MRVFQKLDDLFQFLARFINASNIFKGHTARTFGQHFCLGLAKAHRAAAAAFLNLAKGKESDAEDQDKWQCLDQHHPQDVHLLGLFT